VDTLTTIFPSATLQRDMPWEQFMWEQTPVELRNGAYFKREVYFAPLGYGGINGSKLRQLIHLVEKYVAEGNPQGILTGASVLSPQISMGALVAKHYGLPITVVMGATKPETAVKHENVAIANAVGASFLYHNVGYNPALQGAVSKFHATPEYSSYYRLHYGITTDKAASPEEVEAFHAVGAHQVRNIPDEVEHIYMTAGSCNSCVSVLYGIVKFAPKSLKRITLLGIGPNRLEFIQERLALIEIASGLNIRKYFSYDYIHNPELAVKHNANSLGQVQVVNYDLHTTKYAGYQDRMPWHQDGIDYHPTYEGKALKYMHEPSLLMDFAPFHARDNKSLFWVVGSQPTMKAMEGLLV